MVKNVRFEAQNVDFEVIKVCFEAKNVHFKAKNILLRYIFDLKTEVKGQKCTFSLFSCFAKYDFDAINFKFSENMV